MYPDARSGTFKVAARLKHITPLALVATQILGMPTNTRRVDIYGSQLYGSSGSSSFTNVFTVGVGLPTTGGQLAVPLPGMPTTGASPYSFVMFDRNDAIIGPDVLYVADDRSTGTGGGVQKWTYDGTTWSLVTTLTHGLASFRNVTGTVVGADIVLFATSSEASANHVARFIDDGSGTIMGSSLVMAPSNTVFRGLAISPTP